MIKYAFWHFMNFVGYRRVFYFPSEKGLRMADFSRWEYAPKIPKKDYTENNFPVDAYWTK